MNKKRVILSMVKLLVQAVVTNDTNKRFWCFIDVEEMLYNLMKEIREERKQTLSSYEGKKVCNHMLANLLMAPMRDGQVFSCTCDCNKEEK